jgi:U2-associated protein SR140
LFDGATEASLAPAPVAKPVEPVAAPASEPAPSRFKKGGFKAAFVPVTAVPEPPVAAVEPADDLDGEAMDDEDLDGEAMEDMDGEAMDEDVDGEAM